jgi:hypothetical protein
MTIREGRWDCSSCGSKRIYGRHVDCPGCGRPRPKGVRFYLTDDAPVVTDPERLAEARAGADWICNHCGASTRAMHVDCGGCGAPRGSSPTQPVRRYGDGEVPRTGGSSPEPLAAAGFKASAEEPRTSRLPAWIGGGMIVAVIGGGILQECELPERTPAPVAAVVEDLRWERTLNVSTHGLVAGEGWELPDSAVDVRQESRVREHRNEVAGYYTIQRVQPRRVQEQVGERKTWVGGSSSTSCETVDLGNGYFDEVCEETGSDEGYWSTEPVYRYRTVYDTTVVQQPYYRTVPVHAPYYTWREPGVTHTELRRAAGGAGTPPAWPDTTVAANQHAFRQERYEAIVRDGKGNRWAVYLEPSEWRTFRPGQRVAFAPAGGQRYANQLLSPDELPECRRWHRGRGDPPPDSLGCSPRGG